MILAVLAFSAGCDNAGSDKAGTDRDRGLETEVEGIGANDEWDHSTTYTFKGTATERVSSFNNASTDLQIKINELKNSTTDEEVVEKLDEANEKIAEAREKLLKADKKSIEGNTDDAVEKTEEAREKLDEAREKYMEALEKLEN